MNHLALMLDARLRCYKCHHCPNVFNSCLPAPIPKQLFQVKGRLTAKSVQSLQSAIAEERGVGGDGRLLLSKMEAKELGVDECGACNQVAGEGICICTFTSTCTCTCTCTYTCGCTCTCSSTFTFTVTFTFTFTCTFTYICTNTCTYTCT